MVRMLLLLIPTSLALSTEINTVVQKLEERVNDRLTEHCYIFRIGHRVLHKQARTEKIPLELITLVYRDVGVHNRYNITTAAKQILSEPEFNPKQKLYILVHGYNDHPDKVFYLALIETLLSQGECKVLVLDARELVHPSYFRVVNDLPFIGFKVAEVLADMVKIGVDKSAIHVIGISLGAHICGYIGKGFIEVTGSKLGRITGLDPSRPCFDEALPDMRLDGSDAEFVDVIHTDEELGIYRPIGQVNYYPNGGTIQPNCTYYELCSHVRSLEYFTESVL